MTQQNIWNTLEELKNNGIKDAQNAQNAEALNQLKIAYLGKKGSVQAQMKAMRNLPNEEKPKFGQHVNLTKAAIEKAFQEAEIRLENEALQKELSSRRVDLSLPGRKPPKGSEHPLRRVQSEIEDIFLRMGFEIARGPQAEWDYFNFEALNFPADHPARDMQDTLVLENGSLLRTHTSPVQIRTMLCYPPPIRIIAPGAVYRRDDDITHSPLFHQVEGLHIDKGLHLGHLKGILQHFAQNLFGSSTQIRLRPSFFPFTEPSVEVDIGCIFCKQNGCRICKQSGWIEILGAGMVDPNVLLECDIDPEQWSGWAFGIGVERVAMLLHEISDIRLFYESDQRFLANFNA